MTLGGTDWGIGEAMMEMKDGRGNKQSQPMLEIKLIEENILF